jgi:hypothetical protein
MTVTGTVADLATVRAVVNSREKSVELLRLGIMYLHLIACCVALGLVLTSDIAMVKRLLDGDAREDPRHLDHLQKVVSWALVVLWVTGISVIALDSAEKGWDYFLNPKLQAKIAIVCFLTVNGVFLHRCVLPALKRAGSLLALSPDNQVLATFAGAVSAVSWFYAAMLGIGRPLNWKYSLTELLAAYPVLIGGGVLAMLLLTAWARRQRTSLKRYQA